MYSVIHRLLEDLGKKGLQILGMKTFYFTEKELKEYNENVHYLKLELQPNVNKPVLVLVVAGINAYWKLKKILGSEDSNHAKKH